jgi:hypothetical protein
MNGSREHGETRKGKDHGGDKKQKVYFRRIERLCEIWHKCRRVGEEDKQAPGTMRVLLVLGIPALLALVIYALTLSSSGKVLAIGLLTAVSAFAAGALLGFLFGIPRTAAQHSPDNPGQADAIPKPMYEPNTNLEQISDWLTKILVGVGLVQVGQIGGAINELADGLSPGLGPNSHAVAVTLMISFSITGFLGAYLFTRLRLQKAFEPSVIKAALKKQADALTNPLPLVRRQLDPGGDGAPTLEALKEALRAASSGIREEAFYLARIQRRANWRDGDKSLVDLTIPVFEALIALDDDRHFHRNYAELGYALKDKENPTPADYERAIENLTTAIDIRGPNVAGFPMYEFNRAFCKIKLDLAERAAGKEEVSPRADEICADLEIAAATETGRKAIKEDRGGSESDHGAIEKWLEENESVGDRVTKLKTLAESA